MPTPQVGFPANEQRLINNPLVVASTNPAHEVVVKLVETTTAILVKACLETPTSQEASSEFQYNPFVVSLHLCLKKRIHPLQKAENHESIWDPVEKAPLHQL